MSHGSDWSDIGVFPLQDHEEGVPLHIRQMLVGGRVARMGDDKLPEWAKQNGRGTLGDVHPWKYWAPKNRDVRGMGSWSQAYAGVVLGGRTITPTITPGSAAGGANTTPPAGPGDAIAPGARPVPGADPTRKQQKKAGRVNVLPIRRDDYRPDLRYEQISHRLPPGIDMLPAGSIVVAMAGTEEGSQEDLIIPAGVGMQLVAVNWSPPPEMGTVVYDLEPAGTLAIGSEPGIDGRGARLQSAWRVLRMPDELQGVPKMRGNGLAWQLTASQQDGLAGYGLAYGRADEGGKGRQTTPGEPGEGKGPITPSENPNQGHGGLSGSPVGPHNVPGAAGGDPHYGRPPQGPPGG